MGTNGNQCNFVRMEGLKYCSMHGGMANKALKAKARQLYDIDRYRSRVDRLGGDQFVHLDEELGILRMSLETLLQRFTEVELVTQSGAISNLVKDIRDTLVVNKKLKSAMGELMDRAAMDRLCDELVVVIAAYVPVDKMDSLSGDVAMAIAKAVQREHHEG